MFTARELSEVFPDLGECLRAATLDPYRVGIILDTLHTFQNPAHALKVQAGILPDAARLSPTKLRKELRRLARWVDPDWNTQMFVAARKTRRVVFDPIGVDGLVGMHAYLPPLEAVAMHQHLLKAAQVPAPDPDDVRTVDERMADALTGAVLGTTPGDPTTPMAPKVLVNVFTPLNTLLALRANLDPDTDDTTNATGTEAAGADAGSSDATGTDATTPGALGNDTVGADSDVDSDELERMIEIEGLGPVPAGLLRLLGENEAWRRWVLEPVTGYLKDLGHEKYPPDKELAEYCRARDRYCRYPGCNRRAIRCDLDHLCAWCKADPEQGGSTSAPNLASECRRHHRGKTLGILTVEGDANSTLTWTDQHGHVQSTEPHNYNDGL